MKFDQLSLMSSAVKKEDKQKKKLLLTGANPKKAINETFVAVLFCLCRWHTVQVVGSACPTKVQLEAFHDKCSSSAYVHEKCKLDKEIVSRCVCVWA
jgi:hypothetical protein